MNDQTLTAIAEAINTTAKSILNLSEAIKNLTQGVEFPVDAYEYLEPLVKKDVPELVGDPEIQPEPELQPEEAAPEQANEPETQPEPEPEPEKPKRKRRTKAEIEADNAKLEAEKAEAEVPAEVPAEAPTPATDVSEADLAQRMRAAMAAGCTAEDIRKYLDDTYAANHIRVLDASERATAYAWLEATYPTK